MALDRAPRLMWVTPKPTKEMVPDLDATTGELCQSCCFAKGCTPLLSQGRSLDPARAIMPSPTTLSSMPFSPSFS